MVTRLPTRDDLGPLPSARTGRTIATFDTSAVGQSAARFGQVIAGVGQDFLERERKLKNTEASAKLQRLSQDGTVLLDERFQDIKPTGEGFTDGVSKSFNEKVQTYIKELPEYLKDEYTIRAGTIQDRVGFRAAQLERDQGYKFAGNAIADTQDQLQILIDQNPGDFDRVRQLGLDAINEKGAILPPAVLKKFREGWEEATVFTRESSLLRRDPNHANVYLNNRGVVADQSLPAEAQALLNAIAGTESPGYNVLNGGERFGDFNDHPRRVGTGGTTTAAGRYQFVKKTWDRTARAIGAGDFGPKNQDRGAWWLARSDYARNTGRDLLTDIQNGKFSLIRAGLSSTWEGLAKTSNAKFASAMSRGGKGRIPEGMSFANYQKLQKQAVTQMNAADRQRRAFSKALSDNPVGYFTENGGASELDLGSPDSFSQRADDFQSILDEHGNSGIVINKPLSKLEVEQIAETMKTGSTAEKMAMLGNLSELGDFRDQALEQIKEDDGRTGYVAEMVSSGDSEAQDSAAKVIEGLRIIEDNPDQAKAMLDTGDPGGTLPIFNEMVGLSLLNLDGPTSAAVKDASDALYLRRRIAAGETEFDQELYEQAIQDVLGGEVYVHNDTSIVLPRNVDEDTFETFLTEMEPQDLVDLSLTGAAPVFANGDAVTPEWFEDEARFIQVGRGEYGFIDLMGNKLADAEGNAYIMRLNRATIDDIIEREDPPELVQGKTQPEELGTGMVFDPLEEPTLSADDPKNFKQFMAPQETKESAENMAARVPSMSVDEMEALLEQNPIETLAEPAKSAIRDRLRSEKKKQLDSTLEGAREKESQELSGRIPSMTIKQMREFINAADLDALPKPVLELLRDTYKKKAKAERHREIEKAWRKHNEAGG